MNKLDVEVFCSKFERNHLKLIVQFLLKPNYSLMINISCEDKIIYISSQDDSFCCNIEDNTNFHLMKTCSCDYVSKNCQFCEAILEELI